MENKAFTIIEHDFFKEIYGKAYDEAVKDGETEESENLYKLIEAYERTNSRTHHCWYIPGYAYFKEVNQEIIKCQSAIIDFISSNKIKTFA